MLHVTTAERADQLVGALADVLAEPDPGGDAFAQDLVAVHARGIERWLSQELAARLGGRDARGDGVCANVGFPFPAVLAARAVAAAVTVPDPDPWRAERLVWPLLEVVEERLGDPELGMLARHVGRAGGALDVERSGRRFGAVRRVAQLFDRYAVHRPEMLRAWRDGRDVDAGGGPLEERHRWQAVLWRGVRERLAVPSPPERLAEAVARLGGGTADLAGVRRICVFGLTALAPSLLEVLCALGARRDVHLLLLHPSRGLWERIAAELPPGPHALPARGDQPAARHPLLASWGRDACELQVVLAAAGVSGRPLAVPAAPPSLLGRLQADLRADTLPSAGFVEDRDASVQVLACSSRLRQVEVLRDAVLHLLAADPTLEPRDVIVLCPDVEAFAPLIQAVFARSPELPPAAAEPLGSARDPDAGDPGRQLRVRLADRALRQANPVLHVAADLLDLAGARVTASQVLDLAAREPVRQRFGFSDEDLERFAGWVGELGVRWGLDGSHRDAFGLGGLAQNTWRAGLDRLLLGVAMPDVDDRVVGGSVPYDHVEGTDVQLAGRVAELVARLGAAVRDLRDPRPVGAWLDALGAATVALTATTEPSRWQEVQLATLLADVRAEAGGSTQALERAEVRALLAERLQGRPSTSNHRAGDLVVCTLVPMRSVPHRVVCLLGMDDGAFPRRTVDDGDDLVAASPRVGDRAPRTEDRQLLLDAVLAATHALVVTYTGTDPRTGERRPPCVPIAELLDVLAHMRGQEPEQVAVRHPLRSYDPLSYTAGELRSPIPWRFDAAGLAAAQAAAGGTRPVPAFLAEPLDGQPITELTLEELIRALQHPVKELLRRRLDLWIDEEDVPEDRMPTELVGLPEWQVGDAYLRACVGGTAIADFVAAQRARGTLPPGRFGDRLIEHVEDVVQTILAGARKHLAGSDACGLEPAVDYRVEITLPSGRRLSGRVTLRGHSVADLTYSKVRGKQRLATWVRLLAAQASDPLPDRTGSTFGQSPEWRKRVRRAIVSPAPDPGATLDQLVDLALRARRVPLPLPCGTAAVYAARRQRGASPAAAQTSAEYEWGRFGGEGADRWLAMVYGDQPELAGLLSEAADAEDPSVAWGTQERSRFGALAAAVWAPILERERVLDW